HKYVEIAVQLPVVHVKRAVISQVLQAATGKKLADLEAANDRDLQPVSVELKGWKASAEVGVRRQQVQVKNVVGVLEGSGPLADETVVVGAHYDHLGYGDGPLS